ncbi:hypothetical protein [Hymenobacter edaphi]|uniref:Uncharacterized protein n=1 Tax=Hymenobacter edaphi TaxID=2211146 RepID=A0A328BIB5_9BACT|nr:hypothetical protein [Hymenobacter edaphi]RAK65696.1 hypothetical protein DLM85_13300 [Hymenobacter edaphi]
MRELFATFDEDYFDDRNITSERLLKFGRTVEQNLNGDNPDEQFTPLISLLRPLRKNLEADHQRTDQGLTQRGGSVELRDAKLALLGDYMKQDQKLIEYRATKHPELTSVMLPNGLKEYRDANLKNADTLFNRVIKGGTDFQKELTEEFEVQRYRTLYEEFDAARTNASSKQQAVDQGRTGVQNVRKQYTLALTLCVKTVALAFPTDPKRCQSYFPQEMLRRPVRSTNGQEGRLPASGTVSALPDGLDPAYDPAGTVLVLENPGPEPFRACLSVLPGEVCPPAAALLGPGERHELPYDPALGIRYLNLTNQSPREGRYRLTVRVGAAAAARRRR